jgi:hypothetical protein
MIERADPAIWATISTASGATLHVQRLLHRGQLFDVYEGRLGERRVAIKLASATPGGVLGAHWDMIFSRLLSLICRGGQPVPPPAASGLLAREAAMIEASGGTWNHDATLERADWPGRGELSILVSTFHEGQRLCDLSRDEQRRLLPRMMPSCWRALAAARHGDINPANIIVWPERDRFSLIDPGAIVRRARDSRHHPEVEVSFITSPAFYPILPPYQPPALSLDSGAPLSLWLASFVAAMGGVVREWMAGANTIGREIRTGDFLPERSLQAEGPDPADLLALGVLYYEALTGKHPLFDDTFEEPAWMGLAVGDGHVFEGSLDRAFARLQRPIVPPSAHHRGQIAISAAEDALALSLIELRVSELGQLAALAHEAACSF